MLRSMINGGCKVGFFGLGASNIALLSHLPLKNCCVILRSDRPIDRSIIPSGINVSAIYEGKAACEEINEDILFFSPSVRRDRVGLEEAKRRGVIFSSDAELFFSENKKPIFAITGSDGKSTTAALTNLVLLAGGIKSELIGNIGEPMICHLESDAECYVCELSSFMLTYVCPIAERGCVTNITPNHLDWHKDFEEYKKTKIKLLNSSKKVVISDELGEIAKAYGVISDRLSYSELNGRCKAEVCLTIEDGYICANLEKIVRVDEIAIKERHNIRNLMMAIAMTWDIVDRNATLSVAKGFRGLPHRCERFLGSGGVEYIDSSIDSTPERTSQTLRSLGREVVLILGGRSKGLDYGELKYAISKYVRNAVIVGENAAEIYNAICECTAAEILPDFESAVRRGNELAKDVGALLLSPASTSYDAFKNYVERGEKFKEIVRKLP